MEAVIQTTCKDKPLCVIKKDPAMKRRIGFLLGFLFSLAAVAGIVCRSLISGPTRRTSARASGPIDLNTASQKELEALPGIGPGTAGKIIEGRPYGSVEDLLKVNGLGEEKLEKIRGRVTVT